MEIGDGPATVSADEPAQATGETWEGAGEEDAQVRRPTRRRQSNLKSSSWDGSRACESQIVPPTLDAWGFCFERPFKGATE